MKRTALLLALLASACAQAQQPANNVAEAAPSPAPTGYALRSNVAGASLVRVTELPATTTLPAEGNCDHFVEPVSPAAKLAAQKGWRVLGEERFKQFQVVLIARGGDAMTSGRCNYIDSNLAFFEGGRLIGILYPKGKDSTPIAGIEPVDGHLRVWSTDPMALGQVNLTGTNLSYDEISGGDRVCGGKYNVPTVFGLPYAEARKKLIAAGWRALPSKEEVSQIADYAAARRRFPELDTCAGTGYGECGYTLTAADGVTTLGVVTLGDVDDATVSGYDVACDGKPEQDPNGP
ncbi:hypothetical protein OF829_18740 [Sphingomonas sp. LB-2]|uniref:hypothetical protein n=1 Tax=Sphingomonas caeni TaxID=2984949 RepID=UPI002232614B|nr:hypothetical protein [Sphingomonas caeni]MCW3849280.1 hypothetical protein [Sphingomonas caeni]